MKRVSFGMLVLAVSTLVGTVRADQDKSKPQLRLELDLVDGSHVLGTPSIESVPVQTSYAKVDVPLNQIMTVTIDENHETAAIDMQNGDRLNGVIHLEPIKLETVFGKISVGIEHIREFRIMLAGGALPEWLGRGLVLYYSFDKDEGEKVTDRSGQGTHGCWVGAPMYEAGVKGQAACFRSKDTYIVSSSPRLNMNGWKEATVSFWVSLKGYTTYGHVINRGPLSTDQPGAFELAIGQGYGRGLLAFRSSPTQSAAECKTAKENLPLNRWFHLVMTYDGTALRYYVDGQLEKEAPVNERNTPLWDGPDTKLVIGNMSRLPYINWTDMFLNGLVDEVYIFNRALPEKEVKQIYDTQKPKK